MFNRMFNYIKRMLGYVDPALSGMRSSINSKIQSISSKYSEIELIKSYYKPTIATMTDVGGELIDKSDDFSKKLFKRNFERLQIVKANYSEKLSSANSEINTLQKDLENECSCYKEILSKANEKMAFESKMKHNIGRTRETMPQIDGEDDLNYMMDHFKSKDLVSEVKLKLSQLKPTQSDINKDKVLKMIPQKSVFKDKKYIISKDNYLADGHHTWAGDLELGDKKVNCIKIDLPIKDLLKRMNQLKVSGKKDIDDNEIKKGEGESFGFTDLFTSLQKFLTDNSAYEPSLKKIERVDGGYKVHVDSTDSLMGALDKLKLALSKKSGVSEVYSDESGIFTVFTKKDSEKVEKAKQLADNIAILIKAHEQGQLSDEIYNKMCKKYGIK